MYSINKYKLLRHTFVSNNHGSGFQRPSSQCLNSVDLNFHQEKSHQSCIVTPSRAATLLLISVLVGQQLGVIMDTIMFTAGLKAGFIYTAQTQVQSQDDLLTPLTHSFCTLLFADSCSSRPGGVSTLLLTLFLSYSICKEEGAKVGVGES